MAASTLGQSQCWRLSKETTEDEETGVKISSIARGVPVGSELEYTDEVTLGRSILGRRQYE
jgi:recombination protein RecR